MAGSMAGRHRAGEVTESSISGSVGNKNRKPLGLAQAFKKKPQSLPVTHFLQQDHTFESFQIAIAPGDQTFKSMSLWGHS